MRRLPRTGDPARVLALLGILTLACGSAPDQDQGAVSIGVLLSYTGYLSANSINSERAMLMAIEAANAAGGVGGRRVRILARDTGSDPGQVMVRSRELLDAGVALVIGPDTDDLAIAARGALQDRTIILPSFATSSDVLFKAHSWFVIGAPIGRMACELAAQLRADGRQNPMLILNPTGYNASLAWTLTNRYGLPRFVLPASEEPSAATVAFITSSQADAFVLAAFPSSAVSLVYALLANGGLSDPTRWYLSPTLHSPVFLDAVPRAMLAGTRGVSQGTIPEGVDFQARFAARWSDSALDDAYPFYDAGALAVLGLQRALSREGAIPGGTGLSKHLIAVTHAGGTPIRWNELDRGLERLRQGEEITYLGLSGQLEFDTLGQTPGASASWWTIGRDGFADRQAQGGDCR
jgi:ABC-type branched-subunit amino acid transport system substrate-binding protein